MRFRILVTVWGILLAAPAFSQDRAEVLANIPFPFRVGATSFAAGQYRLHVPNQPYRAWRVRAAAGKPQGFFIIQNGIVAKDTPNESALLFHGYGSTYFLSQVRIEGQELGWELAPSKLEREMAQAARQHDIAVAAVPTEHPR